MGHIEHNTGGICSYQSTDGPTQEQIQEALVNLGKKKEEQQILPSSPGDILGQQGVNYTTESEEVEPMETEFSPEHEMAGAVPGDDEIMEFLE